MSPVSPLSMTAPAPRGPRGDDGDILLGWLTRVVVIFAVLGVITFDAISIFSTRAAVSDDGAFAARAAATEWATNKDVDAAYAAAVEAAKEKNPDNKLGTKGFLIHPDGTVHLKISRTARTVVVYRLERTARWAEITEPAIGRDGAF